MGHMLLWTKISNIKQAHEIFLDYKNSNSDITWIISDLKSKLELQSKFLENSKFMTSDHIMRASEFWKELLFRSSPGWKLVSQEIAFGIITEFIYNLKDSNTHLNNLFKFKIENQGFAKNLFDYVTQLIPVLTHIQGDELIREWFENNPEASLRWGHWYILSFEIYKYFLNEKIAVSSWISSTLVNQDFNNSIWNKNIVVQLGAELSPVEAQLLIQLSKYIDVHLLIPNPEWISEYKQSLRAYDQVLNAGVKKKYSFKNCTEITKNQNVEVLRYASQLAEVKDCVAKIRVKLEQGIAIHQIAIVTPNLEQYAQAFELYFKQEGIGFATNLGSSVNEYKYVQQWLAKLRLSLGFISDTDIELNYYASNEASIPYFQFEKLYRKIYSVDHLNRDKKTEKLFDISYSKFDKITRDEFFIWSLKHLPNSFDFSLLDSIYKNLWKESKSQIRLSAILWLNALQTKLSQKKYHKNQFEKNRVELIKLNSFESLPHSHVFFVGFCESAFLQKINIGVTEADAFSLRQTFDFQIHTPDSKRTEFQARWILDQSREYMQLSYSHHDWMSEVQAPAWLWLQKRAELDPASKSSEAPICIPQTTRWDEVQLYWSESKNQKALELKNTISVDVETKNILNIIPNLSLSASSIESFVKCPFIFSAKKLFKLHDERALDLDIDPSIRGQLIHKIFEKLLQNDLFLTIDDQALMNLIEEAKNEVNFVCSDLILWKNQKFFFIKQSQNFIEFEKKWRKEFPQTKTLKTELEFKVYLDLESNIFVSNEDYSKDIATKKWIRFSGKVDRVDGACNNNNNKMNLVVIDYKTGGGNYSQYSSWIQSDQLQLLFYVYIIQKQWTELKNVDVVSAVYFLTFKLNRDYGFKLKLDNPNLYALNDKKRNQVSQDEFVQLLEDFEFKLKEILKQIITHNFQPKPKDISDCMSCYWRVLCRAPHLNS